MVSFLLSVASKNALKRKFDSILYHSPLDLLTNHIRFLYVKWLSKCMFSFFLTLSLCPSVYYQLISCRWKRSSGNLLAGKRGGVFPQSLCWWVACQRVHLALRWRIITHDRKIPLHKPMIFLLLFRAGLYNEWQVKYHV